MLHTSYASPTPTAKAALYRPRFIRHSPNNGEALKSQKAKGPNNEGKVRLDKAKQKQKVHRFRRKSNDCQKQKPKPKPNHKAPKGGQVSGKSAIYEHIPRTITEVSLSTMGCDGHGLKSHYCRGYALFRVSIRGKCVCRGPRRDAEAAGADDVTDATTAVGATQQPSQRRRSRPVSVPVVAVRTGTTTAGHGQRWPASPSRP